MAAARASARKEFLNPPAPTPSDQTAHRLGGWRRAALWPLGLLARLWGRTLRFELDDDDLRNVTKTDEPVAFVLWHNRLFITAEIFRRYRRGRTIYGLVSASRDGAWLDAFFGLVGIRSVRGSSNWGAREAVTALVDCLRAGHDIGITPDGPRGPRYEFKAGGLIVARRARAAVLLLGAEFESAWQLKSWDRFCLPKPFSRVRVRCALVTPGELENRGRGAGALRERLLAMSPDRPAREGASA